MAAGLASSTSRDCLALSMRRLGSVLGVEAMSLYRYVPGRENLLDRVVETIIQRCRRRRRPRLPPRRLAGLPAAPRPRRTTRRAGAPQGVPARRLTAGRGALAATTPAQRRLGRDLPGRPGQEGFDDEARWAPTARSRASCSGTCCWRWPRWARTSVLSTSSRTGRTEPGGRGVSDRQSAAGSLSEDHSAVEFEEALEELLNRIALMLTQGSRT